MTPYWRFRLANGPLWRRTAHRTAHRIAAHNLACAEDGQRSYQCAVNVQCRTAITPHIPQSNAPPSCPNYENIGFAPVGRGTGRVAIGGHYSL